MLSKISILRPLVGFTVSILVSLLTACGGANTDAASVVAADTTSLQASPGVSGSATMAATGSANVSLDANANANANANPNASSDAIKTANLNNGVDATKKAALDATNDSSIAGFIVKYKDGSVGSASLGAATKGASVAALGMSSLAQAGKRFGLSLTVERELGIKAHVLKSSKALNAQEAFAIAKDIQAGDPAVEFAVPDYRRTAQMVPNDPSYASRQWNLNMPKWGINAAAAWDISTGAGVNVAVIDTGIRPHPELVANLLPGYDFISNTAIANDGDGRDADPTDPGDAVPVGFCYANSPARNSNWHGTHVAGIVAATGNNNQGVIGVAFNAKIVPIRVLGRCGGYDSDILDAMVWAAGGTVAGVPANANPAKVINMSLGGFQADGLCPASFAAAIAQVRSLGAVVVVAAGNDGIDAKYQAPANCAAAITVGATVETGRDAFYSNYGSLVDISAPGGSGNGISTYYIYSTGNNGTSVPGADNVYQFMSGTSQATPHVAGVAALLFAKNPALTVAEVESALVNTTQAFPSLCTYCPGSGIVDAYAALKSVEDLSMSVVYRFYNIWTGAHFYTTSLVDRNIVLLNWAQFQYEGPSYRVKKAPGAGLSPVYRFYNVITQSHFYTISENDKAIVLRNWPQFQFEGVVWYARTTAGSGSIPMYRFYRPATGTHFFTVSEVDKSIVINTMSAHFNYEGEAYQAWGL